MNIYFPILFTLTTTLLLTSCGNDVEEIKNPSTGKLLKRYEYYTDDSGQKIKDGEYVEWDATGKKIAELYYQNDSLHGECTYYNEDGSTGQFNYDNGKPNGNLSLKTKNGNWIFHEQYLNGKLDGAQTYYHATGKKQCAGNYAFGKQTGVWKYFDDEGKPTFTLSFQNGICQDLIGTWELEDARLTTFVFKKDGSFVFSAPHFKHFGEAVIQGEGSFTVSRMLQLLDEAHGRRWEYELFDVEKDRIILINPNAEVDESILSLRK